MQIPGLGAFTEDADLGWYRSAPIPVAVLGGADCQIILDGYDDDPAKEDFHTAIRTFLALDRAALEAAASDIFAYYRDVMNDIAPHPDDEGHVAIAGPESVLDHVRLGTEPMVSREDDQHVYVSVECECAWEEEHGLQIVFRDGAAVTKVGPYDGHLTNAAAYDDDRLDGVVYPAS